MAITHPLFTLRPDPPKQCWIYSLKNPGACTLMTKAYDITHVLFKKQSIKFHLEDKFPVPVPVFVFGVLVPELDITIAIGGRNCGIGDMSVDVDRDRSRWTCACAAARTALIVSLRETFFDAYPSEGFGARPLRSIRSINFV